MKKVLFITNIPNPYRIPLFNEISRQLGSDGIAIKIIFGASSYDRRMFKLDPDEMKFDYTILDDKAHTFSKDGEKSIFLYRGLGTILRTERPDVIIVAGFSSATMKVFYNKLLRGVPYIVYSGSIETKTRNTGILRRLQRTVLIRGASAFVAYGNKAMQYLVNAGADPSDVFIARNTVDTTFFAGRTESLRTEISRSPGKFHLTYVGYLVPRKNVRLLLEAIQSVAEKRRDFQLDIIGDGISRPELEHFVADHGLGDVVVFHGFRQKEELPAFFARSSGFLFQTGFDIWGLVLNEAMAAGLPCLSSPNAGATFDLVKEGETGFVVDFSNRALAAGRINWLLDHPREAGKMGRDASGFIVKEVNLESAARGFKDAINHVLNRK